MNAREAALRALMLGGDAASSLDRMLARSQLSGRDRAFATELAHGALKRRRTLEWSVQTCLKRPFEKLDPLLQWVLLLGAYQVLYLERVPAHSAVDESVALARRLGHAGLAATANAVLRRLSRERPLPPAPTPAGGAASLGLYASLPDWIAQAMIDRFGFEEAVKIAQGLLAPPRRALRVDTTKWSAADASQALARAGFETSPGRYGIPECLVLKGGARGDRSVLEVCIADGRLTVQSEESQLAVHLLDPREGERVLDVCAGRGVKTGAIAMRLRGRGRILALDDDAVKLRALTEASKRFATPVQIVRADARGEYAPGEREAMDAALVDAPCSGLGIIGRRADARWRKDPHDPARFAPVQRDALARAAEHVRDGGRMLYVTCSTSPLEDEEVVAGFLRAHPQWRARRLAVPPDASAVTQLGDYLLSEPGIEGSDGFFYALLERTSS
jgi:16S rRNA (cytosine967-C5)-methyltransferase